MNIYDVSLKAGVSIATVSRVLNGSGSVSEKTRQKVLAVIEESGYTPNAFARGLGLGTMRTVGVMCSDSSDPYLANAVHHLVRELRSNDYDALLCSTGYELEEKQNYMNLMLSKHVDAIILAGSSFLDMKEENNRYILQAAEHVPVMLTNSVLDAPNIYSTVCDDFRATRNAVLELIRSGRTRILFLYTAISRGGQAKMDGYKKALKKSGIPVDEALIRRCPRGLDETVRYIASLYDTGLRFDGVMAAEDLIAVSAVKFARSRELSVPEDLSIIGYNNSVVAMCSEPAVTSIDNRVDALCRTTVNTLMQVLNGRSAPRRTVLSAELVQRGTTDF